MTLRKILEAIRKDTQKENRITGPYLKKIAPRTGEEWFLPLLEALKTNTTLKQLELYQSGLKTEDILFLAEWIKTNKTVTELHLSSNHFEIKGLLALFKAFKTNTRITYLDIAFCYPAIKDIALLSKAIKTNTTLHRLSLSSNEFTTKNLPVFFDALQSNKTLTDLSIQGTIYENLSDEAAVLFFEKLKTNTTLRFLDLGEALFNFNSAEVRKAFCDMLGSNTTLNQLYLGSFSDLEGLSEALKTNTTLTRLHHISRHDDPDPEMARTINGQLRDNNRIQKIRKILQKAEADMKEVFKSISEIRDPIKAEMLLQETLSSLFSFYHKTQNTPMMLKTLSRMQTGTTTFSKVCDAMHFYYTNKVNVETDPVRQKKWVLLSMFYIQKSNLPLEEKNTQIYGQLRGILQESNDWEVDLSQQAAIEKMLEPIEAAFLQAGSSASTPTKPTASFDTPASPATLLSTSSPLTSAPPEAGNDSLEALIEALPTQYAPEALEAAAKEAAQPAPGWGQVPR